MTIAVIPARGNSKRIPRKNIRNFCGKPIIAYSIETALAAKAPNGSPLFDRVVVSTDNVEIAAVARDYGAEVPFKRDESLADDFTGTMAVLKDAVARLDSDDSLFCCIYATAPLLLASDLERGYGALLPRDIEQFAFSVARYEMPVERALRVAENGSISAVSPIYAKTRTQDLPAAWRDAGQFYWCRKGGLDHDLPLFSSYAVGVPMPNDRVCDIDTEEDWQTAEHLFRAMPH